MGFAPQLIPYYGGKVKLAPRYPRPKYDAIVEPFAGGAAYSLLYAERKVTLVEPYELLVNLWRYLIAVTPTEILQLPLVEHVDDAHVCEEAKSLIGWWLNTCTTSPRKRASQRWKSGICPNSFWGETRRWLISEQVTRIKHWHVLHAKYEDLEITDEATWFIDPPYQQAGRCYKHSSRQIDFTHLSEWCQGLDGQVIVCENLGADWLPFIPFALGKTSRAKRGSGKMTNREAVWYGGRDRNDSEHVFDLMAAV